MRCAVACLALILNVPQVAADPTPLLNACRVISEPDRRLACYDRAAGRAVGTTEAAGTGINEGSSEDATERAPSVWQSSIKTSPLTDETTVVLWVSSREAVDCGRIDVRPVALVVRCLEDTTAIYLATHCHMTDHQQYAQFEYRLDAHPRQSFRGSASTDSRALGLWRGNQSIPVIRSMFGRERMIVRATPFGENPFTAEFDITGLETAIAPLRKACNW